MAVVLLILVLLAGIIVPAATAVIDRTKVSATRTTMNVLKGAIAEFVTENPLAGASPGLCAGAPCPVDLLFGPYPPSPTTVFTQDESIPDECRACTEDEPLASEKLDRLIEVYLLTETTTQWIRDPRPDTDYASIESLVLFLRKFSPRAKKMLDGLSENAVTNQDKPGPDITETTRDENGDPDLRSTIDLNEVTDAWGRPFRYAVQEPPIDPNTGAIIGQARWELRSAGPDGEFHPPWTPEELSDDVILRGP